GVDGTDACTANTVKFSTNVSGEASFPLRGYVSDPVHPSFAACAVVSAEDPPGSSVWVPLATLHVAAYDLDGVNGCTADDLLNMWSDLISGVSPEPQRSDYNFMNGLDALDASQFYTMYADAFTSSFQRCDGLELIPLHPPSGGGSLSMRWVQYQGC